MSQPGPDIIDRLAEAIDTIGVCHCGNGLKDGCCDNHAPSWNPCPDTQLLHDAREEIKRLRLAITLASVTQETKP
jgi:hypothetical protein